MAASDASVELIEFIVKAIVTQPDAVKVTAHDDGRLIELETAPHGRGWQ